MDTATLLLLILVAAQLIVMGWLLFTFVRSRGQLSTDRVEATLQLLKAELISKQAESLITLRDSIDSANRLLNERLAEGTSALDRRMGVFGDIENKLGELAAQAKSIEAIGNNITSLSELLKPPKLRGNLGEMLLENLLSEILPPAMFETQHLYSGGQRVDAVVKLSDRLLPIDAKFPLEAYQRLTVQPDDIKTQREFVRALKKHVDDISGKYIKPEENTTDFAIMYIPAEAIYYELISRIDRTGFDYALSKKIVPSSPGHLYGFLSSLASVIAGLNLEKTGSGRKLSDSLTELSEILGRLERYHERMSGSIRSLTMSFEKAREETNSISLSLERLRQPALNEEPVESVDRP